MKAIHGVRLLWSACVLLFIAAIMGLRWGAQISLQLMPMPQRAFADAELLHSIWVKRSIAMLLLCAFCGVLGIYWSLRASEVEQK